MRISCICPLLIVYLVTALGASHTPLIPAFNHIPTYKGLTNIDSKSNLQVYSPRKHDGDHTIQRRSRPSTQELESCSRSQAGFNSRLSNYRPLSAAHECARASGLFNRPSNPSEHRSKQTLSFHSTEKSARHAGVPSIDDEDIKLYTRASTESRGSSPNSTLQRTVSRSRTQSPQRQNSIPNARPQQNPARRRVHLIRPLTPETLAQEKIPNGRNHEAEYSSGTEALPSSSAQSYQRMRMRQRQQARPAPRRSPSFPSPSSSSTPPRPVEYETDQRSLEHRRHGSHVIEQQDPEHEDSATSSLATRSTFSMVDSDTIKPRPIQRPKGLDRGNSSPPTAIQSSSRRQQADKHDQHDEKATIPLHNGRERNREEASDSGNVSTLTRRASKKGSKANSRSSSAQSLQSASSAKGSSNNLQKAAKSPSTSPQVQRSRQPSSYGASSSVEQGSQNTKKRRARRKASKSPSQSQRSNAESRAASASPSPPPSDRKQQNAVPVSPTSMASRLSPIKVRVEQDNRSSRLSSVTSTEHSTLGSAASSSPKSFFSADSDMFGTPAGSSKGSQMSPFITSPQSTTPQNRAQRLSIAPSPFSNARPAASTSLPGSPSHERARPFHNAHSRSYSAPGSMTEESFPHKPQSAPVNIQSNGQTGIARSRPSSQELLGSPVHSGSHESTDPSRPPTPSSPNLSPLSTPRYALSRQSSGQASSTTSQTQLQPPSSAFFVPPYNQLVQPLPHPPPPPRTQSYSRSLGSTAYQALRAALDPVVPAPGPSPYGPVGSPARGSPVRGSPVRGSPIDGRPFSGSLSQGISSTYSSASSISATDGSSRQPPQRIESIGRYRPRPDAFVSQDDITKAFHPGRK